MSQDQPGGGEVTSAPETRCRVIQDRIAVPGLTGKDFRPPWWLRLVLATPGPRNAPRGCRPSALAASG
jgi:hypothetical protein